MLSVSVCLSLSVSVSVCLSVCLSLSLSHTHTHAYTETGWRGGGGGGRGGGGEEGGVEDQRDNLVSQFYTAGEQLITFQELLPPSEQWTQIPRGKCPEILCPEIGFLTWSYFSVP